MSLEWLEELQNVRLSLRAAEEALLIARMEGGRCDGWNMHESLIFFHGRNAACRG